ncbi:hypothetical protein PMAYCL1PPCAC_04784 [Pristionchus mayeri]|uniref:Uncharacterized protein n=1 Tax=Pristionchus mayeri TaxID=1317129 RepID=A0AAN4Z7L0_9BILA|nr:hypothetical protein PMAYCL1PPCAC_04784 [Pristionchus mayeri]
MVHYLIVVSLLTIACASPVLHRKPPMALCPILDNIVELASHIDLADDETLLVPTKANLGRCPPGCAPNKFFQLEALILTKDHAVEKKRAAKVVNGCVLV